MTKKALLFAAVLSGCLGAACAQMAPSDYGMSGKPTGNKTQRLTSAAVCTASPCQQTIVITHQGGSCQLKVEPEVLVVTDPHGALIQWELDGPGDFKIISLDFKDDTPAWRELYVKRVATPSRDQFHDKHLNGRKADIMDKNTIDGSWYYGVVVGDGHTSCKLDPPIINGF